MGYDNYRSGGAAEILTSFGLMLASGFSALSRLLYGVCGTRRDDGGGRYWDRDDGYTFRQESGWRQYGDRRDLR